MSDTYTGETNATEDATAKRTKKSERKYLDANGKEMDAPLGEGLVCAAVTYKSTIEGWTKTITFADYEEPVLNAWAAFGVLTLIGNQTNRKRNVDGSGLASEEEAVDEWLQNMREGNWVTAGGEVTPGIGLVAEGFVQAMKDDGQTTFKDGAPLSVDTAKERLLDLAKNNKDALSGIRKDPRIKAAMSAIKARKDQEALAAAGKAKASVSDLF